MTCAASATARAHMASSFAPSDCCRPPAPDAPTHPLTHARTHSRTCLLTYLQVAIRAVPHRRDFYARLTQGGSHEKFDSELTKWLAGLEVIILRMKDFLAQGNYGTV